MSYREAIADQVQAIADDAYALARRRESRLVALRVGLPSHVDETEFRALLGTRLGGLGLSDVEVEVEGVPGAPRLVSAEFRPG